MRIQHARVRLAISTDISGVSVTAASYIIGHSMEVGGDLHGGPGRLCGGRRRPPCRSVETSMEVGGDLHEPSQTSP